MEENPLKIGHSEHLIRYFGEILNFCVIDIQQIN